MKISSFPPILPPKPRVLILGSVPSIESLRCQQYYAHPRNAFWKIMGTFIGFECSLTYAQRITILEGSNIAVWDVLKHCERQGSLDSAIKQSSEKANEITELLHRYNNITAVLLNGKKAEAAFNRHIMPQLSSPRCANICFAVLPSTSPANARLTLEAKCKIWQQHLGRYLTGHLSRHSHPR